MRGYLLGSLHPQKENQIEENCSPEALPVHKFELVPTTFTYIDNCSVQGVSRMSSSENSALLPRWLFRVRHQRDRPLSLARCRLQPRYQPQKISNLELIVFQKREIKSAFVFIHQPLLNHEI
jgi:hypothetical protein